MCQSALQQITYLVKVVRPYLITSVGAFHLVSSTSPSSLHFLVVLLFRQSSSKNFPSPRSVLSTIIRNYYFLMGKETYLMLTTRILHGDSDTGGHMGQSHSRLSTIDMLTACTSCPHNINSDVFRIHQGSLGGIRIHRQYLQVD